MQDAVENDDDAGRGAPPAGHDGWEDRIIAALDGRADVEQLARLEEHLSTCAACRAVRGEYVRIFRRLVELAGDERRGPRYWDDLADDIEQRVAAEQTPPAGDDLDAAPPASAAASRDAPDAAAARLASDSVVRLSPPAHVPGEEVPLRRGWNGVAGGLVAAAIAVVALVGVYLKGPRADGEPQAFTTPPAAEEPAAVGEGAALVRADSIREGEHAGVADVSDGAASVAAVPDPLATLADPAVLLDDLTPAEAEEVLRVLEAQT